jgi:glycosyltransferase involved in cell wall biosynthesis
MMKLLVIIPAFNEEKTIENVVKIIPNIPNIDQDVLVIDDGSSDNTLIYAKKQGAETLSNRRNMGLGSTFKLGLTYALREKVDYIAVLDADGQYESYGLKRLINPIINENYDLVIGNRFINNGYFEARTIKRLVNLFISTLISKVLLRLEFVYDIQSSFRAFNKKLAKFILNNINAKYNYAQEMFILASLYRFRIKQIPVICKKRHSGKSRLIKNPALHIVRILWICLKTYINNFSIRNYSFSSSSPN